MKKLLFTSLSLALALVVVSCGQSKSPVTDQNDPTGGSVTLSTQIDVETANAAAITEVDAKSAALTHAGLSGDEVKFIKVEMERENGKTVYDVEFVAGDKEYDYEIDAADGKVLACDFDIEAVRPTIDSGESGALITDARAKEIALEHAGLKESDVRVIRIKLDFDDGKAEYEVEFYHGNVDYDYDIDAVSGQVLSFDREEEKGKDDAGQSNAGSEAKPTYIGKDAAKAKAFAHAGVAEVDAKRVQIELDRDDGRAVYEVEFDVGRVEYSYEIDAVTGVIRDFEKDRD